MRSINSVQQNIQFLDPTEMLHNALTLIWRGITVCLEDSLLLCLACNFYNQNQCKQHYRRKKHNANAAYDAYVTDSLFLW